MFSGSATASYGLDFIALFFANGAALSDAANISLFSQGFQAGVESYLSDLGHPSSVANVITSFNASAKGFPNVKVAFSLMLDSNLDNKTAAMAAKE